MSAAKSECILQHLRRLADKSESALADGELLRRYLAAGDQSAFAALVRRHGPMVFAVCQSVVRRRHDAEDAFQAVFLVLARKASSIRRPEALSSFLHGVAYRIALKARADNARRQSRETKALSPEPAVSACEDLSWGELRAVLHAELSALPERLREPLVLCYLEGLTQDEAARRLGWTPATVKGRLQRGREKLRRRLQRRGVALTAALAAALTGQTLAETAVRTARPFTAATATSTAATLASGFLRSWMPRKLVMLSAMLLSAGLMAGGMAMRSPKPRDEEAPAASAEKPTAARPAPRPAVDAHGDPLSPGAVARLGTVRFNHGDGLNALLFSPDGKTILSEGGGSLCLWDTATGVQRNHFTTNIKSTDSQLVWLPDGKTVIFLNQELSEGDVVRVWDLNQKKEIRKSPLPVRRGESSVYRRNALSSDGRFGAINLPTEMRIFDLTTGRALYKLAKGGKEILDVVFAGDRLVTADAKQTIDVWEARTGKLLRRFAHGAPAGFLSASADGRWLAVLEHHPQQGTNEQSDKDAIHVWDLTTGTEKQTFAARPKHRFRAAYVFAGGKRLLTSSINSQNGKDLTVWDVETGERLREITSDAHGSPPILAIRAAGGRLAVGDPMGKFDLWDLKTGRCPSGEEGRYAWAATVFFAPAGDRIYTLGYHSFSTWDGQTGRRLDSLDVPRSYDWGTPRRSFSADGRYAVSFTGRGKEFQAFIWDIAEHRRLHTLRLPSNSDYVYVDGVFSSDSSLLATWAPGRDDLLLVGSPDKESFLRIWDVRTGREVRSFMDGKAGWSGQLSFSDDGKTLIVAGRRIVGFNVADGKKLFSWEMKPLPDNSGAAIMVDGKFLDPNSRRAWRGLAVSPDGTRLACTLDGGFGGQRVPDRIALFDARTGKLLRRWSDSGGHSPSVVLQGHEVMVFSPDGQLLASSDGFTVHLWEVTTGKEIRAFHGHRGEINALTFRGDSRRLASTSWDSTILIWDLAGLPVGPLTEETVEKCWEDLLSGNAGRADRAVWVLAQAPKKVLPILKTRLHPVKPVGRERLDRLIKDLDSDQFDVRQKALADLQRFDELAEPALRLTLQGKPTLEQRRRIEPMLAKLDAAIPSGEALRSLRAVRVLEHAGTPEARRLLRELATGAEGAQLTRVAAAALTRLSRRSP